jgi:guanine nucleotide-binding protein G(i) subunit alpha
MKIIHQNGYSREELLAFRPLIWKNLLESGRDVVQALAKFKLQPISPSNKVRRPSLRSVLFLVYFNLTHYPVFQENCERILAYQLTPENPQFFFSPDIAQAVQEVWADEIIPALMENASKFYLMDSAS